MKDSGLEIQIAYAKAANDYYSYVMLETAKEVEKNLKELSDLISDMNKPGKDSGDCE